MAFNLADMVNISTHSLTRRLTTGSEKKLTGRRYFNSQPHKEADEMEV